MLVLTREIGESIIIDDEVTVKVLAVNENVVRLGVTAPRHIQVHRAEIHRRIAEYLIKQAQARGR
ncbi:carbon storage regulator CsrA [Pseudomonas akapageensis]|uniref:carbon storage regulator CsrA n=1 Tax=Pseudomonas akapageensis TaxID=2609961 RepID=UPI001407C1E6|nr:carbon storage regulator CsrA [Pseudomonas akapageensis]